MLSFWYSLETVSTISTYAQWAVAIIGVIAVIFSLRAGTLKDQIDAAKELQNKEEKQSLANRLALTETELEEAKESVKQERLEREKLEKAVAPRKINPTELASSLSEFKDFTVTIHQLSDLETGLLVEQFKDAMRKANCKTNDGIKMISTSNPNWFGVKLYGNLNGLPLDDPLVRFVKIIRSHFLLHNIQIEWFNLTNKTLPPKTIEMQFGKIPPIKNSP